MTGVPDDIQHKNKRTPKKNPVRLAIRLWGAADQWTVSLVHISTPWHREYWNIQLKAHLKPDSIKSSNTPAWSYQLLVCTFCKKEYILINKNADITCGVYIRNGVHWPEPRSSGGNTSSNPQVSALIHRRDFNEMERMCQHHESNQNSHLPVLVRKPLCNQFIHYHISSRRVFGINHFTFVILLSLP